MRNASVRRYSFLIATALSSSWLCSGQALAQLATETELEEVSQPTPAAGEGAGVIVVTAQKRNQRLLDVPIPVSVVSADDLTAQGASGLQDYFSEVPGLNITDGVGGTPAVVIRGVTTGGFGNPTVGTTVDDVPIGFSTALGGGYQSIELDPADIERVEVLRGPQGTLYGASSLGGLIRYTTRTPSTSGVSGEAGATLFGVHDGELGGAVRGRVNLPIAGNSALSVSGHWRRDAGYIDDPLRNLSNINDGESYGARVALYWEPAANLSILANIIHQDKTKNASDDALGPDLDELNASPTFIPNSAGYETRATFANLVVNLDVGGVEFTSVTGYSDNNSEFYLNLDAVSATADAIFGVTGVPYVNYNRGDKFSQELRANLDVGESINILAGGFYTHEDAATNEIIRAGDFLTGRPVGLLLDSFYPTTYEEYAIFGNVTLNLSSRFDIQLGARKSFIDQTYSNEESGPAGGPPIPVTFTHNEAFTFLITPTFQITPDIMIYARAASGYRPGGPNPNADLFGLPVTFEPDTTRNYDIGIKGQTIDGVLTFDASLYYIDWDNVQVRVVIPTGASVTNAGGARSKGAEVSATLAPSRGLEISGWLAYNDAELTKDLPPLSTAQASAGDRLPYGSRWSGRLAIRQNFAIGQDIDAFIGGSADYVGERLSDFTPAGVMRLELPSYTKFDLQAGVELGEFSVDLFLNNVTDKRGVISQAYISPAVHVIRPRTLGASVSLRY